MVRYSLRAIRALGFLKAPYNDIEIYVEDSTCHNMYLLAFRTILGANVKLSSVNQVGDKARVIAACKADQAPDGRKRLYLIDGDFDFALRRRKPRLKYLYRLRSYDFENLLISEQAIIRIGLFFRTNNSEQQISQDFDFQNWFSASVKSLSALFVVYSVVHHLADHIQTVGFPVYGLCDNTPKGLRPSPMKVRARIKALLKQVYIEAGREAYIRERKRIRDAFANGNPDVARCIAGKSYLFPLLWTRISTVLRFRGSTDLLKVHLASHYDVGSEKYLARALRSAAA